MLFVALFGFAPVLCCGKPSAIVERTPDYFFAIRGGRFPDLEGSLVPAVQLTFKNTYNGILEILFSAYRPPGSYPIPIVLTPVNPEETYELTVTAGRYPDGTHYNFVYGETVLISLLVKGVPGEEYSGEILIAGGKPGKI